MIFFQRTIETQKQPRINSIEAHSVVLVLYAGTWCKETESPWHPVRAEDVPLGSLCRTLSGNWELGARR